MPCRYSSGSGKCKPNSDRIAGYTEGVNSGLESCPRVRHRQPVGVVREVEFPNKIQLVERHPAPTARRESSLKWSYGTLIEKWVTGGAQPVAGPPRLRTAASSPP